MALRIRVSSAKWLMSEWFMQVCRSLMYMRNKIGPRTVPWGTPLFTFAGYECAPLITTVWSLSARYALIQDRSFP